MSDIKLTQVQRSALLVLMAEARKVSNAYLENERKIFIRKKEHRDPLLELGLITVDQERRNGPVAMELTPDGWRRAKEELKQSVQPGDGSLGAALYAILDKVNQFIDRSKISPEDFFKTPEAAVESADLAPDLEAQIRKAYHELAPRVGAWVMLDKIRRALGDAPRAEVDAALLNLYRAPDVHIVPESNQKVLTDSERAAAVNIGNQDKHLISIGV